jgi:putative addiction module killer protein
MYEVRQTANYAKWFRKLRDHQAKNRINVRIRRLALGNFGDVKPLGHGISEIRIPYGPGCRLYFTKQGDSIVLLLFGGDKSSQSRDIELARNLVKEL